MKWAKRRPAVAGLLGTIAVLTAAALVGLTLAWRHANAAWGETELAREGEEQQRKQVEEALSREEHLHREADEQRRKFQRLSVGLLLDRGTSVAEQGDPARGLLSLASGLQLVAKDDADFDRALRLNIAAWRTQLHPMRLAVTRTPNIRGATLAPDGATLLTWGTGAQRWKAATGALLGELPHDGLLNQASIRRTASSSPRSARIARPDSGMPGPANRSANRSCTPQP